MRGSERGHAGLLARARMNNHPGAEVRGRAICYSAMDPLDLGSVHPVVDGSGRREYRGKISRAARCVDASDLDAESPEGLSGEVLAFACGRRPGKSRLWSATSRHKGNWGLLAGGAWCKTIVPYRYVLEGKR